MKILLLNASPKNYGATQEILKIINEEIPRNITSEILCLGDVKLKYCLGDKSCYKTCQCIQDDDMVSIINKIDDSDALIIAAPSYWADVPGQFKVFIDRCTAYGDTNSNPEHRRLRPGKKCCSIALRAGTRTAECEHIIETIRHWCGHMKIDMVDSMYFCEIDEKSDIQKHKEIIKSKAKVWLDEFSEHMLNS